MLVGLMLFSLAGCGSDPPAPEPEPEPTRAVIDVEASAELNPDLSGRPSPLVLRVYELKQTSAFDAADFLGLYDDDQGVLGAELVAREDLRMQPGLTRRLQLTLSDETRHLGFLAAYRDLDQAVWRARLAIEPNQTTSIKVELQSLAIRVTLAR
jgi:type VI secretion system protein VasD